VLLVMAFNLPEEWALSIAAWFCLAVVCVSLVFWVEPFLNEAQAELARADEPLKRPTPAIAPPSVPAPGL
jgi:hypothetical protein